MDYSASAVIILNPEHELNKKKCIHLSCDSSGKMQLIFFLFTGCQKKIGPDLFKRVHR